MATWPLPIVDCWRSTVRDCHCIRSVKRCCLLSVGDVAGGVSYNEKTKKWEATAFRPHQKFVLKMKFLGVRKEEQLSDYKVTVTETKEEDWRRALAGC